MSRATHQDEMIFLILAAGSYGTEELMRQHDFIKMIVLIFTAGSNGDEKLKATSNKKKEKIDSVSPITG